MDWQRRVDAWWADHLRLPTAAIRSGGQFAVSDVDHVGVLEVLDRPPVVYGPSVIVTSLAAGPAGRGTGVAEAIARSLGADPPQVLGPTWYGYTTADHLTDVTFGDGVRALGEADLEALAELHRRTPREQVDESGTDGLPAFGRFDGNRLIAVACLKYAHQMPTIAVLTHPAYRGRGLARDVVAAAARVGLLARPEVQYRAFHHNAASIRVARACGFAHYGDYTVINGVFA